MSFNNDEDGDGLAALFGGVTPQTEPGPRRTAPAFPEPAHPAAAPSAAPPAAAPPAAAPQYPGLAPSSVPASAPVAPAPAYAPPAYQPPAYTPPAYTPLAYEPPASPGYEMPAPTPQASPSYDLPAPAAAPSASPYGAPASPEYPGAPAAPQSPQSYDLPAPADTQYPGHAPAAPTYPPTAQYPAGLDPAAFPSAPPQGQAYAPTVYPPPPAYEPPAAYEPPPAYPPPAAYEPPPAYPPPAAYEPPAAYPPPTYSPPEYSPPAYPPPVAEAPTYSPPAGPAYEAVANPPTLAEPPRIAEPVEQSYPDHPLVRSEPAVPATVFSPGPLLPSTKAAVETPEDLERSTTGEKVGLVLAALAPPFGLVLAIANAARSGRRRGWIIGVVRASLVLGVLSTIAAGIAGYVYWSVRADQMQHAEIAAASAEFCAAAEADPAMVTPPTLGWPAPGASVSESLTLMQAWTDRWTTLAATSPAGLRTGMELLAEKGQTIVDAVTAARTVDDAANQTQIAAAEAEASVATWHTTYCLEP